MDNAAGTFQTRGSVGESVEISDKEEEEEEEETDVFFCRACGGSVQFVPCVVRYPSQRREIYYSYNSSVVASLLVGERKRAFLPSAGPCRERKITFAKKGSENKRQKLLPPVR